MRGMYAIYRKDLEHYFISPVAYIVVGVFLLLTGYFFVTILGGVIKYAFENMMQGMRFGGSQPIDVTGLVLRNFFGLLGTLMLFILPLLSMGMYAEERKRGTMELLMTSPVTDLQIVLGKFLASVTMFAIMLLPTAGYQVYMYTHSDPRAPWKLLLACYIGALLLGSVVLAIGGFISSLTENQLISAVLTYGAVILLWVIGGGQSEGSTIGQVMQYLSVLQHYDDFVRGVIDTSGLIFFASMIVLGIFLTVRSIDSMRWRRA
jgi:ABC-2 type transport system permease protein